MSNAVRGLESTLGARLLHRTTRTVRMTAEGELFYEHAARLLTQIAEITNMFGGSGAPPRGRLRIDVPVALAKPLIIPRLPEFSARYPDIELVLGVSDQPVDLLAEGVDCVLRMGALPASSMVSRVVAQIPMVICGSPGYLAKYGTPRSVEDLSTHRAVTYFSGRARRTMDWHVPTAGELRVVKMRPAIMVNDTDAFVACALAGYGLIQVARPAAAHHLETGQLVEVLGGSEPFLLPLAVMYPEREHLAPQVRAFIDWVAQLFEERENPIARRR